MLSLRRLSLRGKFLVAPAMGLLVVLSLTLVFLFGERNQARHLQHLENQELMMAQRFMQLFGDLTANHAAIYDLLMDTSAERQESVIYERGKPLLYEVYRIESALSEELDSSGLHEEEKAALENLIGELAQYRSRAVSALEIASVDYGLANQHMTKATLNFNYVEAQFLRLLKGIREQVRQGFVALREQASRGVYLFVGLFFLALVATVIISNYLSRLLSDDLRSSIHALDRLASGNRDVVIPQVENAGEVNALIRSLTAFKQSLGELDEKRQETLRINRALAAEVGERKRAEEELRLAASVFESSLEGIMITDPQGRILRVNRAFSDITGYPAEQAVGLTPRLLRSGRHDDDFYRVLWASLDTTGMWQGEIWNRRSNGEVYPEWRNISSVKDADGKVIHYISIFTDITEKKLSEEHIYRLAHYDVLTDLPNRALLQDYLQQMMVGTQRRGRNVGVLFFDLDRFKVINDTLGHPVGDQLLKTVAERVSRIIRPGDLVARLGGDEFVIVLEDLASPDDAGAIARDLLPAIAEPTQLDGKLVYTTASIGISLYPGDGEDVPTLLKNADAAMYRSKEQGGNCYHYFEREMHEHALMRMEMETDLRQAVEQQEFVLLYQPQVGVSEDRVTGMEALLRWDHPQRGMISPDVFIPLAEQTGLIVPIGKWVLQEAFAQFREWSVQGVAPSKIAINLSGRQFKDPELVRDIAATAHDAGVDNSAIELEVTETFLMEDPQQTVTRLNELKQLGFCIAIDDFGTAYSSLSYLKTFPIDRLKIDRTFVRDIPQDKDDEAIIRAVIAMAGNLGLEVIAEGVESREQLALLVECGCPEVQGYLFSRPLTASDATEFLKTPFVSAA